VLVCMRELLYCSPRKNMHCGVVAGFWCAAGMKLASLSGRPIGLPVLFPCRCHQQQIYQLLQVDVCQNVLSETVCATQIPAVDTLSVGHRCCRQCLLLYEFTTYSLVLLWWNYILFRIHLLYC